MDNPVSSFRKKHKRSFFRLKRGWRRDEGWNFMEATMSVVMLTIVFLGFTITLIAFREWMTRAWALRVMDQYANDMASYFHEQLADAHSIMQNPPQYGLGAFSLSVLNFDYSNPYAPFVDSTILRYSARPTVGLYCGVNNTAPLRLDPGFPPQGWGGTHQFTFTEFSWLGPYQEVGRTPFFTNPMARIRFSINYHRPRKAELPGKQIANRSYDLEKTYVISGFMRNYNLGFE